MKRKTLACTLIVLMVFCIAAVAADEPDPAPIAPAPELRSTYVKFQLTVTEIKETKLYTQTEDHSPVELNLTEDTHLFDTTGAAVDTSTLKVGDSLFAFVRGDKPAIAIYPPQYVPDVLILRKDEITNVDVDTYGKDLVNAAGTLRLNLGDDTTVVDVTGTKFDGALENHDLVVFYTTATFSIPAQTTPKHVVVLNPADLALKPGMAISVNGKPLRNTIRMSGTGTAMVPVRETAEALGLEVTWDAERKAVTVGTTAMGVTFRIGEDSYTFAKMTPYSLGQAPVVETINGTGLTYVPASFFSEVLHAELSVKDDTLLILLNQ